MTVVVIMPPQAPCPAVGGNLSHRFPDQLAAFLDDALRLSRQRIASARHDANVQAVTGQRA
jgi:hypothetical protein